MPDYTLTDSPEDLRESLDELNDLIKQQEASRLANEEERMVLAEQVQGALADFEKRTSDYERRRDEIDAHQADLTKQIAEAKETRDWVQMQLDAKRGKTVSSSGDQAPDQGNSQSTDTGGITTREQVEKLKAQVSKPKPALTLDPPGTQPSQASQIDKDLKLMAKIKAKEQKLDNASQNLKENWNRAKGPKR